MSQKLEVESLDDRIVPAASHDLTSAGAAATLPNGAIVRQFEAQPAGTGNIQSFVRIQGPANGGKSEQGYNTSARPLQFDENKSPSFTRAIQVGDVPVVTVGGVAYREFLLDINQKASSPRLSLDEVRIFFGNSPNDSGYDTGTKTFAGRAAAFDLDSSDDVSILLDANRSSGSGSADMLLLVPNTAFSLIAQDSYLFLYSKFGAQPGATANGGFEEWAVRKQATPPITPSTASLSGRVYSVDMTITAPIPDVSIQLLGTDDLGQPVSISTTTGPDGTYRFEGLRAGTYTIIEGPVLRQYMDGPDFVGTVGGITNGSDSENDQFTNIQLSAGGIGVDYNFSEILKAG